jgi:hypothetical protein
MGGKWNPTLALNGVYWFERGISRNFSGYIRKFLEYDQKRVFIKTYQSQFPFGLSAFTFELSVCPILKGL